MRRQFPIVSIGQNGTGVAAVRKAVFDIYGNLNWQMDERGFIFQSQYDVVKGTVTQRIDDVNASVVTGAPSG